MIIKFEIHSIVGVEGKKHYCLHTIVCFFAQKVWERQEYYIITINSNLIVNIKNVFVFFSQCETVNCLQNVKSKNNFTNYNPIKEVS